MVICKMVQCPYHTNNDFCGKGAVVKIDELGACSMIWKNGQRRSQIMGEIYPKEETKIIDYECEDRRQDAPQDGATASNEQKSETKSD